LDSIATFPVIQM